MDIRFYRYNSVSCSLTILGTVDNYASFNFTRSYAGIGTWQMIISGLTANSQRIKNADMISVCDGVAGLITDFKEEVNENGIIYTFSGVELKGLTEKRIIMPPTNSAYLTYTNKSPEYIMGNLIASQLINSDSDRKFNGSVAEFQEGTSKITFNGRFDSLSEVLSNLAETYAIGWYADIQDDNIVWHIVHGLDRSENQSDNNRFILSYDYDTLKTSTLQQTRSIPNIAVVAGQGKGIERAIALVGEGSGLNRGEVYIDARDISDSAELSQRGQEKLAEYGDDTVFEISLAPNVINQYRKTFDLGDIGTIKTAAFSADCILSEVTEVYEGSALVRIDTVFGYDKQSIVSAIKRVNSNADTLVKVEGSNSGGGGSTGTTDYTDLSNKPQINGYELSGNKSSSQLGLAAATHYHTVSSITDFPTLATVATTGSYSDLLNKPTFAAVATSGSYTDLTNKPSLATVATSGSYNDLLNKPSLATVATTGSYSDLLNTPTLATVATSGSYNDLTDKPTIPSGGGGGLLYGTCTTAASTSTKVVTCSNFTSLTSGASIRVKFSTGNTASTPYLNVNSTGAKYIKKYGTTGNMAYMWYAGEVIDFVYDGTYWLMVDGGVATTTYYGATRLASTISNSTTTALTPSAVYNLGLESGTFTPTCGQISSPDEATGSYIKIGNTVVVSFYISGTATGNYDLYVAGFPYDSDSTIKWQAGGGNATNITTPANCSFCGWCIEGSSTRAYARYAKTSVGSANRVGGYCTSSTGVTMYLSGTIAYKIAE